jgi:hypothetical protein
MELLALLVRAELEGLAKAHIITPEAEEAEDTTEAEEADQVLQAMPAAGLGEEDLHTQADRRPVLLWPKALILVTAASQFITIHQESLWLIFLTLDRSKAGLSRPELHL